MRHALCAVGAVTALALAGSPVPVDAAEPPTVEVHIDGTQVMFRPPDDPAAWDAWRESLGRWRAETRAALKYDDALYRRKDLTWAASNFTCAFVMLWDETFWDRQRGEFTPERFLEDGAKRFGGFDSVVLWHAYPRIGFDPRNQFDFYRDMPGGLDGLRDLSRRLHRGGVKVFIDYNPWDRGTRREPENDLHTLADLVAAIEADGIFLDTLHSGSGEFRKLLDAARPGVVLESELSLPVEHVHDHHLSWAQWWVKPGETGPVGVCRNKWFERRHLHHFVNRWERDHTAELHAAWLNGCGMLVWENVFGQLRIWSPRDQSILRAMAPVQRASTLLTAEDWTPSVATLTEGVYASRWRGDPLRLWTLVNRRNEELTDASLLEVAHVEGDGYFDLVRGRPIKPQRRGAEVVLAGSIPARGVGAILAAPRGEKRGLLGKLIDVELAAFLPDQAALDARADFSTETSTPPEELRQVQRTKPYSRDELPPGVIAVPATTFEMAVNFRSRECGTYQTPLKRTVKLRPFAIDETPVTNAQYARFLAESRYRPREGRNFLKHFADGQPPAGKKDHPVVYVDLDDARAYARWAGKRLPTEEEWQYAAGGPRQLAYPWGNDFDPARCNHGQTGGTTPVKAFPEGRSPLGLFDCCGNTWEWTESERRDGRTRFCIVRGGSYYKAEGSKWYADGGPQPTGHAAKFLMMYPGLDRCATIGFRCVVDMAEDTSTTGGEK